MRRARHTGAWGTAAGRGGQTGTWGRRPGPATLKPVLSLGWGRGRAGQGCPEGRAGAGRGPHCGTALPKSLDEVSGPRSGHTDPASSGGLSQVALPESRPRAVPGPLPWPVPGGSTGRPLDTAPPPTWSRLGRFSCSTGLGCPWPQQLSPWPACLRSGAGERKDWACRAGRVLSGSHSPCPVSRPCATTSGPRRHLLSEGSSHHQLPSTPTPSLGQEPTPAQPRSEWLWCGCGSWRSAQQPQSRA